MLYLKFDGDDDDDSDNNNNNDDDNNDNNNNDNDNDDNNNNNITIIIMIIIMIMTIIMMMDDINDNDNDSKYASPRWMFYYDICKWDDWQSRINTLRPRQNACHFPDDIFKYIFLNENVWISIKISLGYLESNQHIPALVQIMAGRRQGYKPLSEPMMIYWRA